MLVHRAEIAHNGTQMKWKGERIVDDNGRMKISMIPYGLLSGFMDRKEIRITELGEDGFQFRLVKNCPESEKPEPEKFQLCFYDLKTTKYRKVEIRQFEIETMLCLEGTEEERCQDSDADKISDAGSFYREYFVKVTQKNYAEEVRRLAGEYSRYIRLKLEGDDGELAKVLTGYPAERDKVHCTGLKEQEKRWFSDISVSGSKELWADTEFALELNRTSMYDQYLSHTLQEFLASYWKKNYLSRGWIAGRTPDRLYIGNQFCHNLFPAEEKLFPVMEKMRSEGLAITLVFSYVREFMLSSVEKLLEKVDNWCAIRGIYVEIVVNDWAVAEMLRGKNGRLIPVLGTLINKRKKDPRMKYKSGDTALFRQNSLNAGFYREFLDEEFDIHRYEWESCGYPQEFPSGKNSLHLPFYQTNTSQYCPLYALCTTGDRGTQQLAEQCPEFCEKYALLYPEHLHMTGMYNSLFGVDKTLLESPEMWKEMKGKGICPDRIVINL